MVHIDYFIYIKSRYTLGSEIHDQPDTGDNREVIPRVLVLDQLKVG
jgi:hypothetical protein